MSLETIIIAVAIVLLLVIILLVAMMIYMGVQFLKLKEQQFKNHHATSLENSTGMNPELLASLRKTQKLIKNENYCIDHPDQMSEGVCAISGDYFCLHCLKNENGIKIGKRYLELYANAQWQQVVMLPADVGNNDLYERILKIKQEMWQKKQLPMIVQGHYKINIQDDSIESFTVIMGRVEDINTLQDQLTFI